MNQPNPPPRPGGQGQTQLPVELPDDVAQGTYSNLMFITHSPSEFVLDFARALPGTRKGKVYSRIVMTPQHAKALAATVMVVGCTVALTALYFGKGTTTSILVAQAGSIRV